MKKAANDYGGESAILWMIYIKSWPTFGDTLWCDLAADVWDTQKNGVEKDSKDDDDMGTLPLQTAPQSESRGIQRGGCRCQRSLHQQDMFYYWEDTQHRKQEAYALLLWGGCGSRSSKVLAVSYCELCRLRPVLHRTMDRQGVESLTDSTRKQIVTDPSLGFTHSFSLYSIWAWDSQTLGTVCFVW